jgi:hypothetical protein
MLWNYIVENNEGELSNTFNIRKHEFIADRGFLRCKEDGYALHAPRPLVQGTHQYTCEDANYSRRVTRIRYVKNEEEIEFELYFYFIFSIIYLYLYIFFAICFIIF